MNIRLFLISLWLFSFCSYAEQAVIVNTETKVIKLTLKEVREIFLLQKTLSPSGVPYKVLILPESSVLMRAFIRDVLKMSPAAYFDTLNTNRSLGKAREPAFGTTDELMMLSVGITEGGIGFISSPDAAVGMQTIKVVEVSDE